MSGRWLGVRGQTAPIGFILVFAILMLLLVTLQTTAVPSWNQGEEFEHSQQVRDELEGVRENVFQTAATGRLTSKSVQLGARYPRRPFLLNPADPSGRIATTEPGTIRLTNLTASGEAGDYWNASGNATREFRTKHLQYRPNYNEYDNAPMTVYENGVLYDRRGNTTLPLTGTPLVDGERLNLVTLTGNLSESGVSAEEVTVEPVSAPQQVTSVSGDGPVRLRLPTRLDEETWNELLADEFVGEGGHVYDNVTVTPGQPYDTVTLSLEGNTSYDLRMARVRIGRGTGQPGPHYVTLDSPARPSVPVGQAERVTVEVRDRYNNPVSGVTVDATVVGGPDTVPGTATTDEDGHATFQYTPTAAGSATIEATFGSGPGLLETATVTVTATRSGGGGDDTGPLVTGETVTTVDSNRMIPNGGSVTRRTMLNLTATATDFQRGGTDIYAVEWWSNRSVPGGSAGSGQQFVASDGTFDTVDEAVVDANIDTATWDVGVHNISIRAQDANGNWGPVTTYQIEVRDSGERPLITAVSPDPDKLADSDGEFIRVQIPAGVNTTGWTLRDADRSVSIARNLDGEVYFARDNVTFAARWPSVDPAQTVPMTVQLSNSGEAVELLDASGTVVDRFAYGSAGDTFDDGSTFTFADITGRVAVRQQSGTTWLDTDSDGDWAEQPECDFFGGGAGCGGDTTAPAVSAFVLTNPSGQTLEVSFDTDEPLGTAPEDLSVTLDGPETQTLTRGDFTEQDNGDGTYTYTATYAASTLGDYTATLDVARDSVGNDGATGQSDSVSLTDTYSIENISATAAGQSDNIKVTTDILTTDSGANVTAELLSNGTVVGTKGPVPVDPNQPQTLSVKGTQQQQTDQIRVTLTDASGADQATRTVPFP
jgi:hypothetical protein